MSAMWNREDAFWVIERLEPELAKIGAHCALGGSVAYRGESEKDLDLIIYPHNSKPEEYWEVYQILTLLKEFFKADKFNDCHGTSQIRDGKRVGWLMTPKGKRVDVFFLR